MKKTIYWALVIILISSCNKTDDLNSNQNVDKIYAKIQTEPDALVQKAIYRTLKASEKAGVWKLHIINSADKYELNSIQKSLVNESLGFTIKENFISFSKFTKTDKFLIWQQKMFENFDRNISYSLFASLNQPTIATPNLDLLGVNCGCSTASDWCSAPGGLLFYCKSGNCQIITSDCGTFWNYDCNGGCASIPGFPLDQ